MSHFVIPVIVAINLWYEKHEQYWYFVVDLLVLSYLGFITYVIFPAAPPWWATKYGYLRDQSVTLAPYFHPELAEVEGPNPLAAMPSLHMAYPSFISIFVYYAFGRKNKWIFLLPIAVGFSAVYLGHHYVIDLIAGFVYALTTFFGIQIICLLKRVFIASN
jgi:membrane-associated phospholipid phosphatase